MEIQCIEADGKHTREGICDRRMLLREEMEQHRDLLMRGEEGRERERGGGREVGRYRGRQVT